MSAHARAALLAALLLAACTGDEQPAEPTRDASAPIQTDSTSYRLVRNPIGWGTELTIEFTNTAPDTIYAVNCNGAITLALERLEGVAWRTFLGPLTDGCLSPPIVVAPGARYRTPWILFGARPGGNAGPQFADSTFAGSYRLVWWNLVYHYDPRRPQLGDTVPLRHRHSNEFTLRTP